VEQAAKDETIRDLAAAARQADTAQLPDDDGQIARKIAECDGKQHGPDHGVHARG
jgi:hypothetical protein